MFELSLPTPTSLSEMAADRIREGIVVGHFKPGERLVETKLSASLGISRAPLREALRLLAADGLVQIRQNRGAYVVSPSGEELESMVLARALTEGAAARLIAAAPSKEVLAELADIIVRQKNAQTNRDTRALIDSHWEFHRSICLLSGNQFLLDLWSRVSNIIRIYSSATIYKVAIDNNEIFLRSFTGGDPDYAEALIRSQIIIMSYINLDKDIPRGPRGYVKYFIGKDGNVRELTTFNRADIKSVLI